jgi:catechol 2,3-dioxygenase-like lactoylglutathione lyase family enzyme
MPMLRVGSVVWGVRDMKRAIDFWCRALDYDPLREPEDDWAILVPRDGSGQRISIKLVTSEPLPRQRHHLDLYAFDQEAEVDRLIGLGAERVEWDYEPDADYVVLADPDGNRFCVIDAGEEWLV